MPRPTLPLPAQRGRDLSVVVWATTIGSVLGPNLVGPGQAFARVLGLPELAGSFVFSLAGFAVAFVVINRLLRPDPLLTARALERAERAASAERHTEPAQSVVASPSGHAMEEGAALEPADGVGQGELGDGAEDHDGSLTRGLRVVRANAGARLGVLTIALGHVVMVSVMVMTPLHMSHGHADLQVIGFVISVHVLGMFAFSPIVGAAVDRWGGRPVAATGGAVLTLAAVLASQSMTGWSPLLLVALAAARYRLVVHAHLRLDDADLGRDGAGAAGHPGTRRRSSWASPGRAEAPWPASSSPSTATARSRGGPPSSGSPPSCSSR